MRTRFPPQASIAVRVGTPHRMKSSSLSTKAQCFGFLAHLLNIFLLLSPWFLTSFMLAYPYFDHHRSLQSYLEYKETKQATGVSTPFYPGINPVYRFLMFVLAIPSGFMLHTRACRPVRTTFVATMLRGHEGQLWRIFVAILKVPLFAGGIFTLLVFAFVCGFISLVEAVREIQTKHAQVQKRVRFEEDVAPALGQTDTPVIRKPFPSKATIRMFEKKPRPYAAPAVACSGRYGCKEKKPNYSCLSSPSGWDHTAEHRTRTTGRPLVAQPAMRTLNGYCKDSHPKERWQPDLERYPRMNPRSAEESCKLSMSSPNSEPKSASGLAGKLQTELDDVTTMTRKAKASFVPVEPAEPKPSGHLTNLTSCADTLLEQDREGKATVDIQVVPETADKERGMEGDKEPAVPTEVFLPHVEAAFEKGSKDDTPVDVQVTERDEEPAVPADTFFAAVAAFFKGESRSDTAVEATERDEDPISLPVESKSGVEKNEVEEKWSACRDETEESDSDESHSSADDGSDSDSVDVTLLNELLVSLIDTSKEDDLDRETLVISDRIPAVEKGKSPIRSFVPIAEGLATGPEFTSAVVAQEEPAIASPIPTRSHEIFVPLQAPSSNFPLHSTPDGDEPVPIDCDPVPALLDVIMIDMDYMNEETAGPAIRVPPAMAAWLPYTQDPAFYFPSFQVPTVPVDCTPMPSTQKPVVPMVDAVADAPVTDLSVDDAPMVDAPVDDAPVDEAPVVDTDIDMQDKIDFAPVIQPQPQPELRPAAEPQFAMDIYDVEPQAPVAPVPSIVPPKVPSVNPLPSTSPPAPQKAPAAPLGFAARVMAQASRQGGSAAPRAQRILEETTKAASPLRNELPKSRSSSTDETPTSSRAPNTGLKQLAPEEQAPERFSNAASSLRAAALQSHSYSMPRDTSAPQLSGWAPAERTPSYASKSTSSLRDVARQCGSYSVPRDTSAPQLSGWGQPSRSKQAPFPSPKGTGPPRNVPVQSSLSKPTTAEPSRPAFRQLRREEHVPIDPSKLVSLPSEPEIKLCTLPQDFPPGTPMSERLKALGTGPMAVSY